MSLEEYIELQKKISIGEEISFIYKGDRYWISQDLKKYYLSRVKDSFTQDFNSIDELFENATIDGKTLSSIYNELE